MYRIALWNLVVPAVVSLGILLIPLAWRRRPRPTAPTDSATSAAIGSWWRMPVALGVGYAIAHVGITAWRPTFPPADVTHWLVYFALAATVIALTCERPARHWLAWLPLLARAVLFGGYTWLLVSRLAQSQDWASAPTAAVTGAVVVTMVVLASLLEGVARRVGAVTWTAALTLTALLSAGGLVLLFSAVIGQRAVSIAVILATGTVVSWFKRSQTIWPGASTVFTMLMTGLYLDIALYSDAQQPIPPLALFAIAPLGLWVLEIPLVGRRIRGRWMRPVLGILIVLALCCLGLWFAWRQGAALRSDDLLDDLYSWSSTTAPGR